MTDLSTNTRSATSSPAVSIGLTAAAAVALLVAQVGPSWIHVPANPQAGVPAMDLDFGAIHDLVSAGAVPTNGVQEAYFGWLAWTFFVVACLAVGAAIVTRHSVAALAATVVAAAGLIVTILAIKGPQAWGPFLKTMPDVRIGGYLPILAYLVLIGVSAAAVVAARRR